MRLIVQACILGLLTGGVYALMASGLTLAFGIMRVINVAQGAMVILGAYLSYSLFRVFHIDPFLSILLITPVDVRARRGACSSLFIRSLRGRTSVRSCRCWSRGRSRLAIEGVLSVIYHDELPLHDHRPTPNAPGGSAATTCPRSGCSRSRSRWRSWRSCTCS